jgi:hypothetical protein
LNGLVQVWHRSGHKLEEKQYVQGRLNGRHIVWNEEGQKVLAQTYKNNLLVGNTMEWYSNGNQKKKGEYQNNKKNGIWKSWYENGLVKSEQAYKDGLPHGELDHSRTKISKYHFFYYSGILLSSSGCHLNTIPSYSQQADYFCMFEPVLSVLLHSRQYDVHSIVPVHTVSLPVCDRNDARLVQDHSISH